MHKVRLFIFFCFISFFSLYSQKSITADNNKIRLALFDCSGETYELFRPLSELSKSVGFDFEYIGLNQLMDLSVKELNLESYAGAIFSIGHEFFSGISTSLVCKKILAVMKTFAMQKNRLIGLMLPGAHVSNPKSTYVLGAYDNIFSILGINVDFRLLRQQSLLPKISTKKVMVGLPSFLDTANLFLTTPVERRSLAYHTTLNEPHDGFVWDCDAMQHRLAREGGNVILLPARQTCSKEVKDTLPYGIYWQDLQSGNHIVLFSSTALTGLSISESFHFCPIKTSLKKEMFIMIQQMMSELKMLMTLPTKNNKNLASMLKNRITPKSFPENLLQLGASIEEQKTSYHHTAWMELIPFFKEDLSILLSEQVREKKLQEHEARQNRLIDYIFASGLDTLWLSLTPNIYYSPIARMIKKDDQEKSTEIEQKFLKAISCFTKKLKQTGLRLGQKIPRIVVGFEIANNLYGDNTPKNFGLDLFGNEYKDIPAPLERSFWEQEIKISLDEFLKRWNDDGVNNGVQLSGVMLDLEMYCRKKTGVFLSSMGFDKPTFDRFLIREKIKSKNFLTVHDRVNYLMDNRFSSRYFRYLEQQAQSLGASLKRFFIDRIPDCLIMCYAPNIYSNWFYKGLYRGLARDVDHPLYLLTFNSEFSLHKSWFEQNSIPVHHEQVVLLSKIKKPKDVEQVQEILQAHHGVWYNRFSRFVEDRNPHSWTSIEQSSMNHDESMNFFELIRDLKKD